MSDEDKKKLLTEVAVRVGIFAVTTLILGPIAGAAACAGCK